MYRRSGNVAVYRSWRVDMRIPAIVATLILVGGGCGGDGEPEPPKLPQLVDLGGPKLAHPAVVQIIVAGGFYGDLVYHLGWLVQSPWLQNVGAEYGVGAGSVVDTVRRPDPPPTTIDDRELVDLLFAGIADGTIPAPTPDTLYMFYVGRETTVTYGSSQGCKDFLDYHDAVRRNGVEVPYAVILGCPEDDDYTVTISRILINAATDPFPASRPGWQLRDVISPWYATGYEVGDLCWRSDESGTTQSGTYATQRSWSNAAAAAEDDPCIPHRYATYYNVTTDAKTMLRIRPGDHRRIQVNGWATAAVGSWKLSTQVATPGSATLLLGENELGPGRSTTLDISLPSSSQVGSLVLGFVLADQNVTYSFLPVPIIVGDPCSSFTDCVSCTSRAGCGFCLSSGRCESMDSSGSAESSCSGKSLATWRASCPGFCLGHSNSCGDCTAQFGCGWCTNSATACMEASRAYAHPEEGSCEYADWSTTPRYCPLQDP